ncbi:T9SS type A sorting domain-containing protein [Nonlabens sp. SY33080]|uniref:T9SS type A sorting domain-containing protein n=1 Tax=Nonlabens sp. SY33080 TaxID=2719911 RepID=UPI00142894EE|nr:T9SS type A sorting domain-containing protein [Nonlabens sp. SY33080]
MKTLYVFFSFIFLGLVGLSQNINYTARITRFQGNGCGNDFGFNTTEEYTAYGYHRDNTIAEISSGCVQIDDNGAYNRTGTFASRTRNNVPATQIIGRIDAWEDDSGSRCTYQSGDDCRTQQTSTFNLTPVEYQNTISNQTVGNADHRMNLYYSYIYSTTSLTLATENTQSTLNGGGTRPFWGSLGSWAFSGNDCAASGTITHNQTSSFSTTVSCRSQVSFRWRVSSEANYDFLEVYVNGVRRQRISGTVGWTLVTLPLDYGNNTIEWRYVKDGSVSVGEDRGFVDQISFTDATSLNAGTITGASSYNIIANTVNLSSTSNAEAYSTSVNYQWQWSNNGVTGWVNVAGASSLSYIPPTGLTTTRFYRRRAQDICGNTSYSNTVIIQILPQFVYDSGSWDPYDPGLSTPIASNSSHSVIVRENTTQTNSFTTGTLLIDPLVTLTTSGDVGIEVTGPVNLNGVLDLGLDGQFVQTNSSVLNVGASGELRKWREGNPNLYRYTYWGSPVSNTGSSSNAGFDVSTVMKDGTTGIPRDLSFTNTNTPDGIPGDATNAATISGRWLYAFRDQPGNYSNWEQISPSTSLLAGEGFTMKGTHLSTGVQPFIFQGIPNNGNINLPITVGNIYLISNPYPSAIDTHQFLLDNPDLDGTVYFWEHYGGNSHLLAEYQGGYATYNFSGGVGAPSIATPANGVSTSGTATKTPGRYIPVAQGFFVETVGSNPINFNNNQRIFVTETSGQSVFVKAGGTATLGPQQQDIRSKIRLGFTGLSGGHRQLLLTVDPLSSDGVDKYYDGKAYEWLSNDMAFDLNGENYMIQGVPNIDNSDSLPLIVEINDAGNYTIGIDELENWDSNQDIYLFDSLLNNYHDLRNASANIQLNAGQYIGRFSIKFENTTLSIDDFNSINDILSIYQPYGEQKIVIQLLDDNYQLESVNLLDINGKAIVNVNSSTLKNSSQNWEITTANMATSTYILQLKVNGRYYTEKVIIN